MISAAAAGHRIVAWSADELVVPGATIKAVCSVATTQDIVATAPAERIIAVCSVGLVITGTAAQRVVAAVADQRVVGRTTGAVDVGEPSENKIFDVAAEGKGDAALDGVGTLTGILTDNVPRLIHHVGIVASAADHRIAAQAAIEAIVADAARERIIGAIADQTITERITGAGDGSAASQGQILNIIPQDVGDAALHRIGPFVDQLGHHIAGRIDDVRVVAGTPRHRICAHAAIEQVVAGLTVQRIVADEAGQLIVPRSASEHVAAGSSHQHPIWNGHRQIKKIGGTEIVSVCHCHFEVHHTGVAVGRQTTEQTGAWIEGEPCRERRAVGLSGSIGERVARIDVDKRSGHDRKGEVRSGHRRLVHDRSR